MITTDHRIRVLLALPHLGGGGAEHVLALLAQHLDPALFELHLVLLSPDAPGSPTLPAHLHIHRLDCRRVRYAALPLLRLIRALQPRLVLSGMAHLSFLILLLKPWLPRQTRILVRQNTTASAASTRWFTRIAYRRLYPGAHRILCQSQQMAEDLAQHFAIPSHKLAVLHNPVAPTVEIPAAAPTAAPRLLFVGRLSQEKGADLLLHAFAKLRPHHPGLSLTLLGIGPQAASLHQLAQSLGIADAVHFAGHANPSPYYAASTLFVLPSRYEGLPNALLEAAAAGLPIVATPASGGLVQLLRDAPGCWLTPRISATAMAQTLAAALTSLSTGPGRFHHAFLAPYRLQPAIQAYSDLLVAESRPALAFLIPTVDQIGGAERQVIELACEFARRRWPVTLIALSGTGGAALPQLRTAGVRYLSLGMRKAWIDPRGWFRYLHWRRVTRPEIVHAHLPHATFFARLVRLLAPVPVLVDTIHTTAAGPRMRRWGYRLTHPLSSSLTCVSRAVQDAVRSAGIAPNPLLLPNGIRLPELSECACQQPPGSSTFHWLAAGRLAPVKDYPTLLQAFAQLPPHATLTIAGDGSCASALRILADHLGIAARVCFLGFQSEMQPLLKEADGFVQSSLWEGLPLAVLEASSSALPVVATSAAGTSETLLHGQTGLLAPVSDPDALATAMLQLMQMPFHERREMGLRGRSFVEAQFSLSAVADQWQQLYRRLLADVTTSPRPDPLPAPSPSHPA